MQVKGEVYNLCKPVEVPEPLVLSRISTRESRISHRDSIRVEQSVQSRQQTATELQLQSRVLQLTRDLEEAKTQLRTVQGIEDEHSRAAITTAGVCESIMQAEPPKKRTRLDGRGRTEAVVLNSQEQYEAAEARQKLRHEKDSMKRDIAAARRECKATTKLFKDKVHAAQKLYDDVQKAVDKAEEAALRARTFSKEGDKKGAASASAAAQKQAAVALNTASSIEESMSCLRDCLILVETSEKNLQNKENELQELQAKAAVMAVEEEEDDNEEDERREEAHDNSNLAIVAELQGQAEGKHALARKAATFADAAATSALVAAAISVLTKAAEKERKAAERASSRAAERARLRAAAATPFWDITNIGAS